MTAIPCDPVFGPPKAGPEHREATTVHTCTRCWVQQAAGLPCWYCGGVMQWWEPPPPADRDEPTP